MVAVNRMEPESSFDRTLDLLVDLLLPYLKPVCHDNETEPDLKVSSDQAERRSAAISEALTVPSTLE